MPDYVFRLMERHQRLDARLHSARTRPRPQPFEIAQLKLLKLALRDRLARVLTRRSAA